MEIKYQKMSNQELTDRVIALEKKLEDEENNIVYAILTMQLIDLYSNSLNKK